MGFPYSEIIAQATQPTNPPLSQWARDMIAVLGSIGTVLGIIFSILQWAGKMDVLAKLKRVIESWEAAVPVKTPEQKKILAVVQGPETTKLVQDIKEGKV